MPTGSADNAKSADAAARFAAVRADFVSNLDRRVAELQQHWVLLEKDPGSEKQRDEVRRRLHALGTRARVLGFAPIADRLEQVEKSLEQAEAQTRLSSQQLRMWGALLQELPSLVWNEPPEQTSPPGEVCCDETPSAEAMALAYPVAVLVVGSADLASALDAPSSLDGASPIEYERTDTLDSALDLARVVAPDVVVLDGDIKGALSWLDTLARDPLTELIPVVALGSWTRPDQAAPWLTKGVARALPKPAPPERLRAAVLQAAAMRRPQDLPQLYGELTLEQLADQLAQQVRSGLVDGAVPESLRTLITVGDGTELLAAIWGAVARVREMLTIRSQGAIRFRSTGPEGAVPIAPWLEMRTGDGSPRRDSKREPAPSAPLMMGWRVLVVDDDPAMTWFLSGLFRAQGAVVTEAHDGQKGLQLAYRFSPELVVSDILMPKLDGFGFCRALKNDILLRDAPIVLLSWKEDLLQRVRELGVDADGYLRKEASTTTVLRVVQEVLRPRSRIESRLKQGGEVKGRLDGLTAHSLLRLVCSTMRDAVLTVRDAQFVYEVVLREGRPYSATRTAFDAKLEQGPQVLVSLLGVLSGRFHVVPSTSPAQDLLQADLHTLLAPAVARARAAQELLSGAKLLEVQRLELAAEQLMLASAPEPARTFLQRLLEGQSPRQLIERDQVSPALLEQVLSDAARRGAVRAIFGPDQTELLGPQTARRLDELQQSEAPPTTRRSLLPPRPPSPSNPSVPRPSHTPPPPAVASKLSKTPAPGTVHEAEFESLSLEPAAEKAAPEPSRSPSGHELASSLAEAVIREVLSPEEAKHTTLTPAPSIVDASELKPRASYPETNPLPSLPPDAIVPSSETLSPEPPPSSSAGPSIPASPTLLPPAPQSSVEEEFFEGLDSSDVLSEVEPGDEEEPAEQLTAEDQEPEEQEESLPVVRSRPSPSVRTRRRGWFSSPAAVPAVVASAVLTVAVGYALWDQHRQATLPVPSASSSLSTLMPAAHSPSAGSSSAAAAAPSSSINLSLPAPNVQEDLALPIGSTVAAGLGLLEIRTGQAEAVVSVDGVQVGKGYMVNAVLRPGTHAVTVQSRTRQKHQTVNVTSNRRTRLMLETL